MVVPFVDLKAQYHSLKKELDSAIQDVIDKGNFIGGSEVSSFEDSWATYLEINHCVTCGNGSDALEIALECLEIGVGDEVIVPACSWIATSGAVSKVGAKPVFADVLPKSFSIDPVAIRKKITENTKAIIPVHLYGRPAEMTEIISLAMEYDLKVIEDCAQAHGAVYNGSKVGTLGHISTFSFYPVKNLGAYGDAGCIVANDEELAAKARMITDYGRVSNREHLIEGRNSRLDTLQAAILDVKLKYLDNWNKRRFEIASYYNERLAGLPIKTPSIDTGHVFHLYVIEVEKRDDLKSRLEEKGIITQIHYPKALPELTPYLTMENLEEYPVARKLVRECLSLPIYPELTFDQIDYVVKTLIESL